MGEPGLTLAQIKQRMGQIPSRDPEDPAFRRYRYLRHGSRLLLGLAAPATEARQWGVQLMTQLRRSCSLESPLPRLRPSGRWLSFRGFRLRAPGDGFAPRRRASGKKRCFPRLALRAPVGELARWLGRVGLLGWAGGVYRRCLPKPDWLVMEPWGWGSCANPALLRHSTSRLVAAFSSALQTLEVFYRGVDNPASLERLL